AAARDGCAVPRTPASERVCCRSQNTEARAVERAAGEGARSHRNACREGAGAARSGHLPDGAPHRRSGNEDSAGRKAEETSTANVRLFDRRQERGAKKTTHIFLRDTPYHFFIDAAGQVAEGRDLRFAAYS